jgi:hypothetical protein
MAVDPVHPTGDALTRRRFLTLGTMTVAGAGLALAGCSGDSDDPDPGASTTGSTSTSGDASSGGSTTSTPSSADPAGDDVETTSGTPGATVFTAADFAALGTCLVLPELTAGPFPTIEQMERRDITEGKAGHPLRVGIQVVDEACVPIPGATVEIWHCDIDGDYSAYADRATENDDGEGTSFFRGFQVSNDEGIVEFHTVYPGWYSGRAIHIHSSVHIDDSTVLTTQYLFEDDVNDAMMSEEPYAPFGEPDTPNQQDGVTGGSAEADGLLMAVSDDADIAGSRALIVVGVDPSATSSGGGGGGGGMGGPPPQR